MKKRVRIYKAQEGGQGRYINQLSKFIPTAQDGMQQEADPQQLIAQVASLVAPPPYGEGQDPTQVYQTLAQTYGEETAAQLINAAAAYVQQIVAEDQSSGSSQMQASENPDLTYQEELIRQEQEAQEEAYNNAAMAEDDYMFDEMLMEDNPALQEEQQMRLGGAKKKFVKDALKLAKKQLGDTGDQNNSKADPTDILDGRQRKSSDFLTTIKNQATLSTIEKQAKNIAETIFKPEPRLQMGGFTGQDLFKFVYGGGDDPSVPALTQAENGIEIKDSTGKTKKVTQEEADLWNESIKKNPQMTLDDLSFASESRITDTTNWKNWNNLITQGYGSNIGGYREGIDYSRVNTSNFGKQPNQSYNYNQTPYRTGTILDALLPGNGIFNKTYTMTGTNLGGLNPKDLMKQGFTMDKERLGFGHKRYTFSPVGSEKVTAQNKDQQKQEKDSEKNYKIGQFFQKNDSSRERDRSPWLKNWIDQIRGNRMGMSVNQYGGIPKYQGAVTGSAVNTQTAPMDFKPRSDWQTQLEGYDSNNQFSILGTLGITEKDQEKYQNPSLTIDEKTSLNGENFLNVFNPVMQGVARGLEKRGQQGNNRMFLENLDSTNQYTAMDPQFRGNYEINSGLFRPDQMGQLWQSREGGQRRKTGQQSDWGLSIFPTAMGGSDINQYLGIPQPQVQDSLSAVPRDEANLEAEGGETAFGDINGDGFPEHMKIVGPRHSSGGVPLNLPDDTFIFSDTRSMKISDPKILKMFNKPAKKGGYTPAELAKPYDINKYRKILEDPDTDIIARKTAELMIKNFNVKLGALALAQESKKGFPQGIPVVARPYMEMMGIQDEDLIPEEPQQQQAGFSPSPEEIQMMQNVDETGMPPVDQMAMQQEDMSGMPMEGMPMAAYGMQFNTRSLKKAAQGLSKDPCPEGMVWDPVYGCVPELDQHMQKYTPEQIDEYFNRTRKNDAPLKDLYDNIIRDNPDYFTLPADDFILQQYRDNHIPVIQFEDGTYGVDYMNLDDDQRQQKSVVDRNYLNESMKALNKAGYPPNEWMEQMLNQNNPNKLQNDRDLEKQIEFYKQLDQYQQQYEQNMQDCPCRKKVISPSGTMSQICVPCEEMPMAAYGMTMGGYDMPYYQVGGAEQNMQYLNEEPVTMNRRDMRISQKPYYHMEPTSITNPNPDRYWLTAGDRLKNLRSFITGERPDLPSSGVSYQFQDGGELEQYQKKGEVQYDVKDKNLRPDIEGYVDEKGVKKPYMFVDPADEFRYEGETVGQQTKATGYSVDPESGFYYNPSSGKKPGKAGLEDFYRRHKDFIDLYEGKYGKGKDAWMKEHIEAKGKANPAMTFVVDNLNALYKKLSGKEMVDIKQKGAYIPGVELFNLPGLQLKPKEKEEIKKTVEENKELEKEYEDQFDLDTTSPRYIGDAPWWLQDQIKMAGAFGDLMGIKKYYPWAPKYQPAVPEPAFLDPTRSIAAQSEQAKILGDTMAQFSPSGAIAAGRLSGLQGQLAKGVADTQSQYDTANVQIANQFAPVIADTYNKAQMYNQGVSKQLYDANTILNQQYDNARRALKNNLLNQYTNAITNRMKTDALNQIYPQFAVDPSVGGKMYYTGQSKKIRPEASKTLAELYQEYYDATGDREAAQKFAMLQYKQNQSGYGNEDMYPVDAMMSLYGNMKHGGGTFTIGPGMMPPLIL